MRAVAVGRFDGLVDRDWPLTDVLTDHLSTLGVPVLADLPVGAGQPQVPTGVPAILNATDHTLSLSSDATTPNVQDADNRAAE